MIQGFQLKFAKFKARMKYQAYFDQFNIHGFYPKIVQQCRFSKKIG